MYYGLIGENGGLHTASHRDVPGRGAVPDRDQSRRERALGLHGVREEHLATLLLFTPLEYTCTAHHHTIAVAWR
eukprot:scaffold275428_cov27-Tisochrysis_lutea.AAC.6